MVMLSQKEFNDLKKKSRLGAKHPSTEEKKDEAFDKIAKKTLSGKEYKQMIKQSREVTHAE